MLKPAIIAMICITGLEIAAIVCGIDGAVFGIAIAAISGLGGYEIHAVRTQQEKKQSQERRD